MIRLGCVKYLNARPLVHGWRGQVVLDHPAALCKKLAGGDLDVALVSSVEFLRNPIYRIVDGISISSDGPVYSVIVVHHGHIAGVKEIDIDPASQTSVALLRCLLAERGLDPQLIQAGESEQRLVDPAIGQANLLIGDQAIRFRQMHPEYEFWDLGEEWKRIVDLPFVFALWLIRPELSDAETVAGQLRALQDQNLGKIDNLIAQEKEFDAPFCRRYFSEHLRFTFGEAEREGLLQFQRLCVKHELLPEREISLDLV
jgi:chorismate dehydratase